MHSHQDVSNEMYGTRSPSDQRRCEGIHLSRRILILPSRSFTLSVSSTLSQDQKGARPGDEIARLSNRQQPSSLSLHLPPPSRTSVSALSLQHFHFAPFLPFVPLDLPSWSQNSSSSSLLQSLSSTRLYTTMSDPLIYLHLVTPCLLATPLFFLLPQPPPTPEELPGVRPITIRTVTPRRAFILALLSLLAISSFADTTILVVDLLTANYRGEVDHLEGLSLASGLVYAVGGFLVWALAAILCEWRARWGDKGVLVLGSLGMVCESGLAGATGDPLE